MIRAGTLCSHMFREFPRSYHEMPLCNIPREDYCETHAGRGNETTKFRSLFICSQAFVMSGNNLHFQIQYDLAFSLNIHPEIDIQLTKYQLKMGKVISDLTVESFKRRNPVCEDS